MKGVGRINLCKIGGFEKGSFSLCCHARSHLAASLSSLPFSSLSLSLTHTSLQKSTCPGESITFTRCASPYSGPPAAAVAAGRTPRSLYRRRRQWFHRAQNSRTCTGAHARVRACTHGHKAFDDTDILSICPLLPAPFPTPATSILPRLSCRLSIGAVIGISSSTPPSSLQTGD
jgi:hypothetical protein